MRRVPLSMLTPDMILGRPVYHFNNLVLKTGTRNLGRYQKSLERIGITALYIIDEAGEEIEIADTIKEETRIKCRSVLYETFFDLNRQGHLELEPLADSIDGLLEEILENPIVSISLSCIGSSDDSTFTHSVNTTVYSLMLGKELQYSYSMMKKLAMGTILHDVGKTLLDQSILYKKGKLTSEEFQHIKLHPQLGYEILKEDVTLTELSRIIALQHHERLDGSGYPLGLKGDELHEVVRIAAIADVYDAVTSQRCYHKKRSNLEGIQILVGDAYDKLDAKLLEIFVKKIVVYPNGTMVKLSDGTFGVIKKQNPLMPYSPVVQILAQEGEKTIRVGEVDLSQNSKITIIEAM